MVDGGGTIFPIGIASAIIAILRSEAGSSLSDLVGEGGKRLNAGEGSEAGLMGA